VTKALYEKEENSNLKKSLEKQILEIARQIGEYCLETIKKYVASTRH